MITYSEFWIFAACLLGAVQCFLLTGYFFLLKRGNVKAHRLFATLMLLIGIRLLKSGHYLFVGETMPQLWMNLGFWAHFTAGPVSYFYIQTYLANQSSRRNYLFHLLPPLILMGLLPWIDIGNFWYVGGYHFLLYYTLAYFAGGIHEYLKQRKPSDQNRTKWWISSLLLGVGTFFLAYFSNYVLRAIPYAIAPVLYW